MFTFDYPTCDESKLVKDEVEIAVQINSKVRAKILVPGDADNALIEKLALENEDVKKAIEGKNVVKVICVPGRLVNIVVK